MGKSRRRAAWGRPALLLVYAVALLVFVPYFAWLTVEAVSAGRAIDAGVCDAHPDGPCLDEVAAVLRGPHYVRRSFTKRWEVLSPGGALGDLYVGDSDSRYLQRLATPEVTALTYGDVVAAVETPDGRTIENLDVGARGAVESAAATLLVLGGGLLLLRYGVRKRRAFGGWWAKQGPAFEPAGPTDVAFGAVVAASGLVLALLAWGVSWPWAVGVTGLLAAALGARLVHNRRFTRENPGRHSTQPD